MNVVIHLVQDCTVIERIDNDNMGLLLLLCLSFGNMLHFLTCFIDVGLQQRRRHQHEDAAATTSTHGYGDDDHHFVKFRKLILIDVTVYLNYQIMNFMNVLDK